MAESLPPVKCAGYSSEYDCNRAPLADELYCAFCKGRRFELEVCEVFRDLGGKAIHNITVDGSQCDIAAEFEQRLGTITYYIECKAETAGVNDVNKLYNAFTASRVRHIDKAVLVSAHGFTADAKAKSAAVGVVCFTLEELRDRRADFEPYLSQVIAQYEESLFFKTKHYLALTASPSPPSDIQSSASTRPLDDYLDDFFTDSMKGPLLLVLGDFGCGKTTTLQRFFWRQAKPYLAGDSKRRIPIFINLRDFHMTMDLNKTLVGMLIDEYGMKMQGLRVFRELNREGKLILLLDAFDEMVAKVGPEYLVPAFQQFEKVVHPHSKVVITVRTQFLRSATEISRLADTSALQQYAREQGYPLVYIHPLDPDRIEEYINKINPKGLELMQRASKLNQLATRPILLDMIVQTLPKLLALGRTPSESDLYHTYTEQWLERDDWRCRMDHRSRRFFSQHLAYFFFKTNTFSIHYTLLPPIIQKHFPEIKQYRELEHFEVDVRTSTFLTRDPTGKYSFSHKSFYEYFVAAKIVDDVLADRKIDPADRFTPEMVDFIEDIFRSGFGEMTPGLRQRVLVSLFEIYSNTNQTIADSRSDLVARRTGDIFLAASVRQVLSKLVLYANAIMIPGEVFVIFEYTARKYLGPVCCALNATGWKPTPMINMEGTTNRFLSFALIPQQIIEYKYLEDNSWEPRDNRVLDLGSVRAFLQTDDHFEGVW
jgi:hypothetical protein